MGHVSSRTIGLAFDEVVDELLLMATSWRIGSLRTAAPEPLGTADVRMALWTDPDDPGLEPGRAWLRVTGIARHPPVVRLLLGPGLGVERGTEVLDALTTGIRSRVRPPTRARVGTAPAGRSARPHGAVRPSGDVAAPPTIGRTGGITP